jgi:hypothetical protein
VTVLMDAPWHGSRIETAPTAGEDLTFYGARVVQAWGLENSGPELGRIVIVGRCAQAGYFDRIGERS